MGDICEMVFRIFCLNCSFSFMQTFHLALNLYIFVNLVPFLLYCFILKVGKLICATNGIARNTLSHI